MYEILEKLLKDRGITAYRLAKETGISTATLSNWKKGKYTPKQDKLMVIARHLNVSLEYLMGWTDDPIDYENIDDLAIPSWFKGDAEKWYKFKQAELDDMRTEKLTDKGCASDITKDPSFIGFAESVSVKKIPVLGEIRCGEPMFAEGNIDGYVDTPETEMLRGETYFWLRANGDSMINAGICPGDYLFIRAQSDVDSGDIAVVNINGDTATLKRVIKKDNAIALQPENPAYETKLFVGQEMNELCIQGRLMKVERRF